jgi:hypothetical protein
MSSIGSGSVESDDGGVLDAVGALLVADPAGCGHDDLSRMTRQSLRVRGWLDAIDARIAVQAGRLAGEGGSTGAATVLTGGGRRSRRDAEAAAARGAVCAQMPVFADALADGTVTAGHVDAVVAAARHLDGVGKERLAERADELVAAAAISPPEQFAAEAERVARAAASDDELSRQERLRRDRNVRRWVDKHTGMCNTKLSLDPLADAKVWTSISAALATARAAAQRDDDRTWDQLQADVVADLLTRSGGGDERRVPEVSVLIDMRTLVDTIHDTSTCETSEGRALPVETLRRLCCEADVLPIVLGGAGEVLDVGRQCRVATRAQRRALRAMYRTCAHPQCTVPFDACRIHHVTYWFHGGASDLDNLVPICETHHHLVHEGGWTLQLFADRRTIWRLPDGTVYHDGITTDRVKRTPTVTPASPTMAETVAAELELALTAITSRAPP